MKHNVTKLYKRVIAMACAALMIIGAVFSDIGTIQVQAAAEHTLWLVGDSTVCSFNDAYYYPRYGYGTQIENYLDGTYTVQNLALSGRSSKSYLADQQYTTLKNNIQAGDVLVIGFGHNDEKAEAERYTNPNGDYQTEGSFAKSLYDNYVKMAQDKGAEVILCTPIARRSTAAVLTGDRIHVTADATAGGTLYEGGDYAEAIRKLGTDTNVAVVDLTALTKELYEDLGPDETLYLHAWTTYKPDSVDNTHLNIYGAKKVAWLFANAAKETQTALASHISLSAGEPAKDDELVANPSYVIPTIPTYDNNLAQSKYFSDYEIEGVAFKGTSFGNGTDTANVTLETDTNGNMHIAVKNNKGKITSTDDGIAMYYYKVPAGKTFTISAKATINSITDYGQVGFGLMARDDMYIDKVNTEGINSDYVAAGSLAGDYACNCFFRFGGTLYRDVALTTETVAAGQSYDLKIVGNTDGYACTFGNEPTQTGDYDFALTSVDSEYVYIGMFAARSADITFSDIYLEVDGQVLVGAEKFSVTVSNDGNGTAKANLSSAAEGDTVTLTAVPNDGFRFKEWQVVSGGVTVADNQFTMPAGNVEIKAVFEEKEPLRTEWDFKNDTTINGANGVSIQNKADTFAGLQIDATNGKFDSTVANESKPWVQVNVGTIIKVPVDGPCKVYVYGYAKEVYSVDGEVAAAAEQTFTCEGTDGFVTIEATGQGCYIQAIKVTPISYIAEGKTDFQPTDFDITSVKGITVTGISNSDKAHGPHADTEGAKMVLNLSERANVIVETCGYGVNGNGVAGTMTASSGTVSQKEITEGDVTGLEFTVSEAEKGELTLTFANDTYIHSVTVDYIREVGPRNIDVWDFGGKLETDTALYTNNILPQEVIAADIIQTSSGAYEDGNLYTKGDYKANGQITFGDLTQVYARNDRLYTTASAYSSINKGTFADATKAYSDYTPLGAWYCNGTGGETRRYIEIANVQAGDKIVAYMGITSGGPSTFHFQGLGTASAQDDTVTINSGSGYQRFEFIAEYTGTYKIWEIGVGKPMYHRIVRVPVVAVSGTIDFGTYTGSDHTVKFVNQTTKEETIATLDGTNFTANLTPGYTYTAVLSGATGYGFSNSSKTVVTTDKESVTGKDGVELSVIEKDTYTFSGKVVGFADGYDVSKLVITLVPPAGNDLDEVVLTIDKDLNFSGILEPEYDYKLQIAGVNDYEIRTPLVVNKTANYSEDITVGLKTTYAVTGEFFGTDSIKVTALTFENVEDGYVYTANVTENGYSASLRDGTYLAIAEAENCSTRTHVFVEGKATSRDLMFVSTLPKENIPRVSDLYVGYPEKENNYETIRDAVEACKLMAPSSEAERITVHIAPGTYREQVIVEAPYVSFVNDTSDKVLVTWYYGIGYNYYSIDETGYYNPEYAYDKYEKHAADKWGAAVFLKSTATAFRAEGITFESSFNYYLTEEELADGVEVSGESTTFVRKSGVDVANSNAKERATAMAIEADKVEFKNCDFLSCQDTLYTGGGIDEISKNKNRTYFKNCLIEGLTDYIFGDGSCIFDGCELSWKGYSNSAGGGVITACRNDGGGKGYLFRDCTVTANPNYRVSSGTFGRPWRQDAHVTFLNTILQSSSMISAGGWQDMSGNLASKADFYEYNTTTASGSAVSTSGRVGKVLTKEAAEAIVTSDYFEEWIPVFYDNNSDVTEKATLDDFAVVPVADKTYGDAAFTLSVTGEEDATGAVTYTSSDESVVKVNGSTAEILKAGTVTITAVKAEDDQYNEASADITVTVNRKDLTVTADDKLNVVKGSAMPELTYKAEGLVNGDTFTTAPVMTTAAADTNTAGTYDIEISGGTVTNAESYNITYVKGKLTIVDSEQKFYTITVTNGTAMVDGKVVTEAAEGQIVTLTADELADKVFTGWTVVSGGVTIADNQFTMPAADVSITAEYKDKEEENPPVDPQPPVDPEPPVEEPGLGLNEDGEWAVIGADGEVDTTVTGLVEYDGSWFYVSEGYLATEQNGFVEYDGAEFYVAGGQIQQEANGLVSEGDKWYFVAGGQKQSKFTGFAEYDGNWFVLVNGVLDHTYNGLYDYNGATFVIAEGRMIKEYSGLYLSSDGNWYYVSEGRLLSDYVGLALYDGAWFYIANGILAVDFTGWVNYDGSRFYVVNGMLQP